MFDQKIRDFELKEIRIERSNTEKAKNHIVRMQESARRAYRHGYSNFLTLLDEVSELSDSEEYTIYDIH